MAFTVEETTLKEQPLSPGPEPTLRPDEIEAWNAAWNQWDAFVTFVAKNAAGDALDSQRRELFAVLVEARYDILDALAPAHPGALDPVRPLFVSTWTRLAPVLREISLGVPGEAALRYLTFITAADALRAIDALGPSSGLDISADGLRRLARMIAPSAGGDPLAYDEAVDPELRERFGFGPPPPPPEPNPDVDLSWFWPGAAYAAGPASRLNHWVPTRDDLDEYLPLVRDLLNETAEQTLDTKELKPEFHQLYRWLVLATAWKESCWRQFVNVNGRIRPMLSSAGAVGIMQVLPRVWRGFYDVGGLQQDIAYNARAGSEILIHYLRDYAVAKGEHTITGSIDNLARSTYAMYNGGPGQVRRYRTGRIKRSLRAIDEAFWDKFRKVKAGNELGVAECFWRCRSVGLRDRRARRAASRPASALGRLHRLDGHGGPRSSRSAVQQQMAARRKLPHQAVDHVAAEQVVDGAAAADAHHHGVDAELAGGAGDALGGAVGDRPHRQQRRALALRDAMGEQQRLAALGIRLVGGAADEEAGPLLDVDRVDGRAAAAALATHGLAHQQRVRTAQRDERGRRVELAQILRVVEADDLRHFLGHDVRSDDALVGAPARRTAGGRARRGSASAAPRPRSACRRR